jgi:8-oxo-dGTP pyrophosphatase MutT (NUDIX family)
MGLQPPIRRPELAPRSEARPAAVLVLLFEQQNELHVPLILRRQFQGDVHSGQISFPGGGSESGESPEQTALREAHEELGIGGESVEMLGRLSPHWIPVSGYLVTPVVGCAAVLPQIVPDPSEVEEVLVVSLDRLAGDEMRARQRRRFSGVEVEVPGWQLPQGFLWGATAMMLAELLAVLPSPPSVRVRAAPSRVATRPSRSEAPD